MPTKQPLTRPATALGWLKRTDAGTGTCDVWEAPCGRVVLVVRGEVPTIAAVSAGQGKAA